MSHQAQSNICSVCHTRMTVQESSALQPQESTFFFLYCKHCGYGSSDVYASAAEAIQHWNEEIRIPTYT